MSCLDATFTLTPKSPFFFQSPDKVAVLFCYGADFTYTSPSDFTSLYTTGRFCFDGSFAADPSLDYSKWANRKTARHLFAFLDLRGYGTQKQLALVFGFDVMYSGINGRLLIYSDAGLLQDQQLVYGDNQLLLEIESLDQYLNLYFVHAGGPWFFRGISGYVV